MSAASTTRRVASINAGYATVGTDTGHQGAVTVASWALNDIERQLNFGHVGVHRVAEVSKAIIRHYYNAGIERSYFSGCSNGGRQALMEAQRYPDDFDGIIAGAPAADFTGIGAQFIKDIKALYPDPRNVATSPFTGRDAQECREPDRREVRCRRRCHGRTAGGSAALHDRRRRADRR